MIYALVIMIERSIVMSLKIMLITDDHKLIIRNMQFVLFCNYAKSILIVYKFAQNIFIQKKRLNYNKF
jgi:hypothetical protein